MESRAYRMVLDMASSNVRKGLVRNAKPTYAYTLLDTAASVRTPTALVAELSVVRVFETEGSLIEGRLWSIWVSD
jgi:hypothetical protein